MASGQDPLADMQNLIGFQGLVGSNPYLPSGGPDSNVPGGGLPIPKLAGYYTGEAGNLPPTDATGKPIQSFVDYNNNAQAQYQQALAAYNAQPGPAATPGTTLNTTPSGGQPASGGTINYAGMGSAGSAVQELLSNYQAAQAKLTPQQQFVQAQNNAFRNQQLGQQDAVTAAANAAGGFGRSPGGAFNPGPSYSPLLAPFGAGAGAAPAAPAGKGPPPSPPDLRQAYLNALANPGPPPQYGAAPPQPGQTPTGSPQQGGAMNAFLAANTGKNTPFLQTLRGLQTT